MRTLTLAVAGTLLLATLDAPHFAPEAGSELKKVITTETKAKSSSIVLTVDGNEHPMDGHGQTITFENHEHFEIHDEYVKCAGGRPTHLKRSFGKLTSTTVQGAGGGPDSPEMKREKESGLTGRVVHFKWDDKAGDYTASFEDEKADPGLLKGLDPDLDFLAFLPGKDVELDAEWSVTGAGARALMYPGGNLRLKASADGDAEDEIDSELVENLSSQFTAVYKGTREVEGEHFAVIRIEGTLRTNADEDAADGGTVAYEISVDTEGEILWDAVHHHVHSVHVEGTDKTIYRESKDVEMGGKLLSVVKTTTLDGTTSFDLKLEK